ncbi:hypothetical protein HJC23_009088 [Cyclotella cryptica]|uniref:Uncharacterized protein n=1 Tax=Cyclotella cryptica TaxID=29204 RepID=A0ABD3R065_9STRA
MAHARTRPLSMIRLLAFLLILVPSPIYGDGYSHDGGMWGAIKEPIQELVKEKYDGLSDKGRFCVGMGVGFGCTKFAVGSKFGAADNQSHSTIQLHCILSCVATVKAAKTVGAAYIAFEALEYAGLLKEARANKSNRKLIEESRDYLLRTMDGIRYDIRTTFTPAKIKRRIDEAMKRDKAGTAGLGAGVFMGLLL